MLDRRAFLEAFSALVTTALFPKLVEALAVTPPEAIGAFAERPPVLSREGMTLDKVQLTVTKLRDEVDDSLPGLREWAASFYYRVDRDPLDALGEEFDLAWSFGNVQWQGVGTITLVEPKENGWWYIQVTSGSPITRTWKNT